MSLVGRVAIITGAAGGIGSCTARAFVAKGAHVVLADVAADKLEPLARELDSGGVTALSMPTDLTSRADIDRLIAQTLSRFGRIDVLANVAGVGSSPALSDTTDEELERVLAVNLLAAARLMHAVLPIMKGQRSGSIVNIGSVAGEAGVMGIYSASKFGLRGLTDSVRREARSFGIGVTLIEPGFVRTAMNPSMTGRLPGPEIVAAAIVAAAEHPRRVRIVPGSYALAIFLFKLFPAFTDLVFGDARIQERLNRDSRAQRNGQAADAAEKRG